MIVLQTPRDKLPITCPHARRAAPEKVWWNAIKTSTPGICGFGLSAEYRSTRSMWPTAKPSPDLLSRPLTCPSPGRSVWRCCRLDLWTLPLRPPAPPLEACRGNTSRCGRRQEASFPGWRLFSEQPPILVVSEDEWEEELRHRQKTHHPCVPIHLIRVCISRLWA